MDAATTPAHVTLSHTTMMQIGIGSALVVFIVSLFFVLSAQKTMRQVPKAHHVIPMWLLWFILLPIVGSIGELVFGLSATFAMVLSLIAFIILVIMLPFAIPNALARHFSGNESGKRKAQTLKTLGLLSVIFMVVAGLLRNTGSQFAHFVVAVLALAAYVFLIIYWVKLVGIRECFHQQSESVQV